MSSTAVTFATLKRAVLTRWIVTLKRVWHFYAPLDKPGVWRSRDPLKFAEAQRQGRER